MFFVRLVAFNDNDQASQELFKEAGFMLGSHLRAISAHIDKMFYKEGILRVVAVGSVFRSWKFLKPGEQKSFLVLFFFSTLIRVLT